MFAVASLNILVYHDRPEPPPARMYCTLCKTGAVLHNTRTLSLAEIQAWGNLLAAEAQNRPDVDVS